MTSNIPGYHNTAAEAPGMWARRPLTEGQHSIDSYTEQKTIIVRTEP
jgi:hypothetical protein